MQLSQEAGAPEAPRLECAKCNAVFESRNRLFQHLKASSCSALPQEYKTQKLALIFGYDGAISPQPKAIGSVLCALDVVRSVNDYPDRARYGAAGRAPGMSCSSSFEQRTAELFQQDPGASAISDVLCVTCEALEQLGLNTSQMVEGLNSELPESVRVFGCLVVPLDFHAESSCLRRCYEYTLPMTMLFNPANDYIPDLSDAKLKKHNAKDGILCNESNLSGVSATLRLGFFQALKKVLREFHSVKIWHNFTNGAVATDAVVKREVGRFQHSRTICDEDEWCTRSIVLLSASADSFLIEMFRKMTSVVVAAMQGLITEETLQHVLHFSGILPTIPSMPLAPASAELFLVDTMFKKNFNPLFTHARHEFADAQHAFKEQLLTRLSPVDSVMDVFAEFVEKELKPWAQAATQQPLVQLNKSKIPSLPPAPPLFERVLRLLREADTGGSWPSTSEARARLIASDSSTRGGDSFSLGAMPPSLSQPRANAIFPELMKAAFELEVALNPLRESSSTIAVNRHAVFLPHVDNGAGAGQGISQIVALGDFVGGEIVVESEVHDIRYQPLEFNGWTQRHWTLPFEGERFSLVFFTPLGCETTGLQLCQQLGL